MPCSAGVWTLGAALRKHGRGEDRHGDDQKQDAHDTRYDFKRALSQGLIAPRALTLHWTLFGGGGE